MPDILFKNASLVLADSDSLRKGSYVLVSKNHIKTVSSEPVGSEGAIVVDVDGRTLMPGLIDAHAHITGLNLSPKNISYPASEIVLACSNYLQNSLMDGFTTIREAGGADHSIAQLLAKGTI